jgi:hypothetical protein
MTGNITLSREVMEQLLKMLEMVEPYADQLTDYSSTAAEWPLNLLPEKVSEAITALRAALAAPQPESKTPAWWVDGLTATLMREGVNKHRAREIAVGYWEAYCQIPGIEEDIEECWVANLPRGDKT